MAGLTVTLQLDAVALARGWGLRCETCRRLIGHAHGPIVFTELAAAARVATELMGGVQPVPGIPRAAHANHTVYPEPVAAPG